MTFLDENELKKIKIQKEEIVQIKQKVENELTPYINGLRIIEADSKEFKIFKENYIDFIGKYKEKQKILDLLLQREDEGFKISSFSETGIELLFAYLGFIESIGNALVDILIMLVVANEIDFHIVCRNGRIKHVTSIKELEEERVSLSFKLQFLEDNDINTLTSFINSHMRNQIAHLNFTLRKNRIYIKSKRGRNTFAIPLVLKGLFNLITTFEVVEQLLNSLANERKISS